MDKIELSQWRDDKDNVSKILNIASQIENVLQDGFASEDEARTLTENTCGVLKFWTGNTYVGVQKEEQLSNAFQQFFNALYKICDSELCNHNFLYEGELYRLIGHCDSRNCDSAVTPQYNGMWASWSKEDVRNIDTISSKLYGTKTFIKAHTGKIKGIDINAFGINDKNPKYREQEVVFPMIKEQIDDVVYISEDLDDDED